MEMNDDVKIARNQLMLRNEKAKLKFGGGFKRSRNPPSAAVQDLGIG
jgi:hypothetical protein